MDILSLVEDAKKEHLSFEKHPATKLDIEQKTLYLNGLALLMNVDEEMHEKEKEYLTILIRTFDLPDEKLNELIQFAKKPSKKAVLEIFDSFKEKDIKYVFMFDALMLAHKDENFNPKEQKLIDSYFESLKISPREKEQVKFVYEKIIAQDKEALFRFFMQKDAIKRELYEYLLEYYGLGSESPKEIKKKYKKEVIKIRNGFNLVTVCNSYSWDKYKDISLLMDSPISNKTFASFLQYMFDTNQIVFEDTLIKTTDGKTLFDLSKSSIKFNNGVFETKKEEPVKRFSINGIFKFVEWINSVSGEKFSLPEFYKGDSDHSFKYIELDNNVLFEGELIYEKYTESHLLLNEKRSSRIYFEPKEYIKGFNTILDATFRLQKKVEEKGNE